MFAVEATLVDGGLRPPKIFQSLKGAEDFYYSLKSAIHADKSPLKSGDFVTRVRLLNVESAKNERHCADLVVKTKDYVVIEDTEKEMAELGEFLEGLLEKN